MLLIKSIIGGLFKVFLIGLLLLVPAGIVPGGTWFWERGLLFLAGYGVLGEILIIWISIRAPKDGKRPKEDKIILPLFVLLFVVFLIIIPIDFFYINFLPKPGLLLSVIGVVTAFFGILFNCGAIAANAYITPRIQDQTDEGQKIADSGVFSIVRHPYYSSFFLVFGGMALWLESLLGVIALIPILILFIVRIGVEERTLETTLTGYIEYKRKVKYRLIPFIW